MKDEYYTSCTNPSNKIPTTTDPIPLPNAANPPLSSAFLLSSNEKVEFSSLSYNIGGLHCGTKIWMSCTTITLSIPRFVNDVILAYKLHHF